jgi:electron transport complex protein RnfD
MRQIPSIQTSPHIKSPIGTEDIMRHVVYALIPLVLWATVVFGWSILLLVLACTAGAVLAEHWLNRKPQSRSSLKDSTAIITGILLALTLPPAFPLWMGALGGVISIALGKLLFGGIGFNVFNPALVGRSFLQAAFPVAITSWSQAFALDRFTSIPGSTLTLPFLKPTFDAFTGATPLGAWKFTQVSSEWSGLFFGTTSGSTGETSSLIILLAGAYLAWRHMLDWKIPAGILGTVAILSSILFFVNPEIYPSPQFMLFSGGLMLGAVFMATDMVTSPITPIGVWLYGILIGILVVVIRIWGGLPEGVMYSILLGNACTPLFNRITQPRVFGAERRSVS